MDELVEASGEVHLHRPAVSVATLRFYSHGVGTEHSDRRNPHAMGAALQMDGKRSENTGGDKGRSLHRRHRSRLERRQVVKETLRPGASVALIAQVASGSPARRENGVDGTITVGILNRTSFHESTPLAQSPCEEWNPVARSVHGETVKTTVVEGPVCSSARSWVD